MKCLNPACSVCAMDEGGMPPILTKRHGNKNYTAISPAIPLLRVRDKSHRKAWEKFLDHLDAIECELN